MLRPFRTTASVSCSLLLLGSGGCRSTVMPPVVVVPAEDPHQIEWQRSLDDALALAKQKGLPILLAVNMDGESASDRIVHEEYRDEAFVAASRHYICLVASLFRHNPRDFDDLGRRIPCPRLGSCTCGEHIALEPLMHDRFLADGERVAPRHAMIALDGRKLWDMSLSFDLKDIDRAVIRNAGGGVLVDDVPATSWDALAEARSAAGREALERALVGAEDVGVRAALDAMAAHGDAGSVDAIRLLLPRLAGLSQGDRARFVEAARKCGIDAELGRALRTALGGFGADGAAPRGVDALRAVLEQVDGGSEASRALLLARSGPFEIDTVLAAAAVTREAAGGAPALAGGPTDDLATADALLQQLTELDARIQEQGMDTELRARYAKASLDLARRHMETKERDVAALLTDAELNYRRALEADPGHADWWIERARTAYFEQRFDDESAHARQALRRQLGVDLEQLAPGKPLGDPVAVEALRWVADGAARRYGKTLRTDPAASAAAIAEALRAFGVVAASACGNDGDWASLASFCGSLGLWREQFLTARAGALRFPASPACRQWLNDALWKAGRAGDVVAVADEIAARTGDHHPAAADAQWYAGYACILDAENHRRAVRTAAARASYAAARERYLAALRLRADYADSCHYWIAMTHMGDGLAAVRAGERTMAADDLVQAVRSWSNLAEARDGLGYDVLDLVDKICEWRATGPSPVDAMKLLGRLDEVAPDTALWAVALGDSQLREALRADGRNPERVERDTVDAAGKPIRMLMGVPNEEGDAYLRTSLRLLRHAKDRLVTDEDKKALAQSDTIWAERQLERGRLEGVAESLREAAAMLGVPAPGPEALVQELRAVATDLRGRMGEARPRWRMGR